jgi:hypothetical protein
MQVVVFDQTGPGQPGWWWRNGGRGTAIDLPGDTCLSCLDIGKGYCHSWFPDVDL